MPRKVESMTQILNFSLVFINNLVMRFLIIRYLDKNNYAKKKRTDVHLLTHSTTCLS
jgi:hypothetical protein